jgi:hypothetical protein
MRDLSEEITSEVVSYHYELPAKIYAGTVSGYIYKVSTGAADFWSPPVQISGSVVKSPAVDDGFTREGGSGVSSLWWGTKNGYVYRLSLKDGSIIASTQVVSAISTNIEYDAGFYDESLNTLNIYFGTEDGRLYCRYGLNLSSVPFGWNDLNLNSKINSVYLDNKILYVATDDGVYKVNVSTNNPGSIVWFFKTESPVVSNLILLNNYIYFVTQNGLVYCIDKESAKIKNNYPIILDSPFKGDFRYQDGKIVVGTSYGKIIVLEEK